MMMSAARVNPTADFIDLLLPMLEEKFPDAVFASRSVRDISGEVSVEIEASVNGHRALAFLTHLEMQRAMEATGTRPLADLLLSRVEAAVERARGWDALSKRSE